MPNPMTPAELRAARDALGLTQPELGERLGVHWTTVSRWENARLKLPPAIALAVSMLLLQEGK